MRGRARVPSQLLGAAVALGVGWRVLQEFVPGRLDWALGFGVLFIVLVVLHRRGLLHVPDADGVFIGVPAVLLMIALIWRDSEMLFAANLLALAGLVACARPVRVGLRSQLLESGVGDLVRRALHAADGVLRGGWRLARAASRPDPVQRPASIWSAGLGVVAISPVLLLFSVLLGSADPVFGRLLGSVFKPDALLQQAIPIALWAWLAAGLLWALTRPPSAVETLPKGGRVRMPAMSGALLPIAALFFCFLVAQARYLFGGRGVVLGTAELSFSEYARDGFFELVTVSATMLPILLVADWAADQHAEHDRRRFRLIARALLVLLTGLLASALLRMSIYAGEYGLTELRLFTTVFMLWLAFVFAWFAASVLRGRREHFVAGALGSALATLILLNLAGPDAIIVRLNVQRAEQGRPFDSAYFVKPGAGVVPAALELLPALPKPAQCDVATRLIERWGAPAGARAPWTIERWRASGPLLQQLRAVSASTCPGGG